MNEQDTSSGQPSGVWKKVPPWLVIVVLSALAHLWCLKSQFFLDDLWQIRDSDWIRLNQLPSGTYLEWFYICLIAQVKVFGMSSPAIHAFNWLLHTAVACVLYFSACDYLEGRKARGIALFGALLFAVHPLGSEIPNYARTQDLAWVTLFSLLAAWMFFRFSRDGGWSKLLLCALFIVGATFSKGPGLFHAASMVGMVGLVFYLPRKWPWIKRRKLMVLAAVAVTIVVLCVLGRNSRWWNMTSEWGEPRFIGHGLTICRVFWEFTWRGLVPIKLCADHHIAETLVQPGTGWWGVTDTTALIAAGGMMVFTLLALVLLRWSSTRMIGLCFFLYAAAMLLRFLYFVPEYMPEYRIYPGLPWFCLGMALLLGAFWHWLTKVNPVIPASLILGCFVVLSAKRSFQWHDLNILMADVLKQYPTQARAVWVLQRNDLDNKNWQAVIDRHRKLWPQVHRAFLADLRSQAPRRELPTGHHALAEVGCRALYARALAEQKGAKTGLRELDGLEGYMIARKLDKTVHWLHWQHFRHAKALLLEKEGRYREAYDLMEPDLPTNECRVDFERIRAKRDAAPPQ